jgi:hypothetical protein
MNSPPVVPARERTASVRSRNLPGGGSESAGGVPGRGGPCIHGGAQEPAGGKQTGRAVRNAFPHGTDPAYSTPGACPRAWPPSSTGRGRSLSATPPLPCIGGPLSTARTPRRSSWRCDSPSSSDWFIRTSRPATPTATLTIHYLTKPRHFQPGASISQFNGIELDALPHYRHSSHTQLSS